MRIKIIAECPQETFIPYNYHYQMSAALYSLIEKSSPEYSEFLHNQGFFTDNRKFKLFTFSKLTFHPFKNNLTGFEKVKSISFQFSTPIEKSFEHLILGLFAENSINLGRKEFQTEFHITHAETLPDPQFEKEMYFRCLSPIAASVRSDESHSTKHYLDYMDPQERENYISAIFDNLKMKFKTIFDKDYTGNDGFSFSYDPLYIVKKSGKIRKMVRFGKSNIIGMEAPFKITADPELIKIGYDCGFGVNNSAGFGCVEVS